MHIMVIRRIPWSHYETIKQAKHRIYFLFSCNWYVAWDHHCQQVIGHSYDCDFVASGILLYLLLKPFPVSEFLSDIKWI